MESTSLIVKPSYCFSPSVWKPVMVTVSLSASLNSPLNRGIGHWARTAQISNVVKDETHSWMPWEYGENEEKWVSGCGFPFGGSPDDLHPKPASSRGWLRAAPNTPARAAALLCWKTSPGASLACSGSSSTWKGSWSRDNWGFGNWPCKGKAPCCSPGYGSCFNAFDREEKNPTLMNL